MSSPRARLARARSFLFGLMFLPTFTFTFMFTLVAARVASAQSLPPDFVLEPIGTGWASPVGIAFFDGSHQLVAEKTGRLWWVVDGARRNVVLDMRIEVLNHGDRGLLDVALDPEFARNGFIYLLLTVDPTLDGMDTDQEAFARLVRYTTWIDASDELKADLGSRVELLGATWPTGVPSCHLSHTIGTLRFLPDGSLLCSAGDGAHFDSLDTGGRDPGCFGADRSPPEQDIGAFRSQQKASLAGKILRLDPRTGLGVPSNPWFDGDPMSNASRAWALGLRNPFRFAVKPGLPSSLSVWIGDVGLGTWEEIDVARGGENFGWPCYEGTFATAYQDVDQNGWCGGGGFVAPALAWHHSDPGTLGFTGTCVSGVTFYTGVSYPPVYRGGLFFCDFARGWMKLATLDANDQITSILPFASGLAQPISLVSDPDSGDLYLITVGDGRVLRLRYDDSNKAPVAVVSAEPSVGRPPLDVQLSGSQSYDPEGGPLTFHWDLGDGDESVEADPRHVYVTEGEFTARLTLTDLQGATTVTSVVISTENTAPAITAITSPLDGSFYANEVPVTLAATAVDAEDDGDGIPLAAVWHVDLVHDHHTHPDWATIDGLTATLIPESHGPGTYYRLTLVVTDSNGASVARSLAIFDADGTPRAHLVALSDHGPRVGQDLMAVGHMEYPGKGPGDLVWEWGDGTVDTLEGFGHQVDASPHHRYRAAGTYELKLTARAGPDEDTVSQMLEVRSDRPAVAVFVPLVVERVLPSQEQEAIASAIVASVTELGCDARVFYYSDQTSLEQWILDLTGDSVRDVLVVLDLCPVVLFSGERDASLAERWLESGDGIVWTGAQPFAESVLPDGTTLPIGESGGDLVLDAAASGLFAGEGLQQVLPLAVRDLPSLVAYTSDHALRLAALGPAWGRDRLYAADLAADLGQDHEADALVISHASQGFYAQFFCAAAGGLPRADVLIEFLKVYALSPCVRVPVPPRSPRPSGTLGG